MSLFVCKNTKQDRDCNSISQLSYWFPAITFWRTNNTKDGVVIMLISTEVEIVWSKWNKEYYIDKGYAFTEIGSIFIVKIEDVDPKSKLI